MDSGLEKTYVQLFEVERTVHVDVVKIMVGEVSVAGPLNASRAPYFTVVQSEFSFERYGKEFLKQR